MEINSYYNKKHSSLGLSERSPPNLTILGKMLWLSPEIQALPLAAWPESPSATLPGTSQGCMKNYRHVQLGKWPILRKCSSFSPGDSCNWVRACVGCVQRGQDLTPRSLAYSILETLRRKFQFGDHTYPIFNERGQSYPQLPSCGDRPYSPSYLMLRVFTAPPTTTRQMAIFKEKRGTERGQGGSLLLQMLL